MRLIHIFIFLVAMSAVGLIGGSLARLAGVPDIPPDYRLRGALIALAILAVGITLSLHAAWLICASLHVAPLSLFAPRCPHCRTNQGEYNAYKVRFARWPKLELVCPVCDGAIELWLRRRVQAEKISTEIPSFSFRWPEFLGVWRRLEPRT